ncbi:MAG TPA: ABC transporter permease [Acidobacteriota bacterium]
MRSALAVLAILYLLAIASPFISPYPPHYQNRENALKPPLYRSEPASRIRFYSLGVDGHRHLFGVNSGVFYLLGSDSFGRDLFSRICFGARISLTIGLLGALLTLLMGTAVGLLAASYGKWLDAMCVEAINFVLSLPSLLVVLALRALFPLDAGATLVYLVMVLILALVAWPDIARVIRSKILVMKSEDFTQAAVAIGVPTGRLVLRHFLPALVPYWLVQATLLIPSFLLNEVTLSFLGAGIQEPDASWGNILRQGLSVTVLSGSPWILLPGLFIIATVVSFSAIGEHLSRRLEPGN